MIVEVTDWNLYSRYYDVSESDLKKLMTKPRSDRKDFFKKISTPTQINCESQVEIYLPIYTGGDGPLDDNWEEHEEIFREYFGEEEDK